MTFALVVITGMSISSVVSSVVVTSVRNREKAARDAKEDARDAKKRAREEKAEAKEKASKEANEAAKAEVVEAKRIEKESSEWATMLNNFMVAQLFKGDLTKYVNDGNAGVPGELAPHVLKKLKRRHSSKLRHCKDTKDINQDLRLLSYNPVPLDFEMLLDFGLPIDEFMWDRFFYAPPAAPGLWKYESGEDLRGGGFHLHKNSNPPLLEGEKDHNTRICLEKCAKEPNCKAVVFNGNRELCWAKDSLESGGIGRSSNRDNYKKCKSGDEFSDCKKIEFGVDAPPGSALEITKCYENKTKGMPDFFDSDNCERNKHLEYMRNCGGPDLFTCPCSSDPNPNPKPKSTDDNNVRFYKECNFRGDHYIVKPWSGRDWNNQMGGKFIQGIKSIIIPDGIVVKFYEEDKDSKKKELIKEVKGPWYQACSDKFVKVNLIVTENLK
jgi:hypothetical protein